MFHAVRWYWRKHTHTHTMVTILETENKLKSPMKTRFGIPLERHRYNAYVYPKCTNRKKNIKIMCVYVCCYFNAEKPNGDKIVSLAMPFLLPFI